MRLLSYNVASLRAGRANVAATIRSYQPDVVAVQEAPRRLRWRSKCAALARESGLVVITGGRTAGGVLLLVALRVSVVETFQMRLGGGGLAVCVLEVAGQRYTVTGVDLRRAGGADERVRDVLARFPEPLVVAREAGPTLVEVPFAHSAPAPSAPAAGAPAPGAPAAGAPAPSAPAAGAPAASAPAPSAPAHSADNLPNV
ncbi:MAG: endonuclease/exonuclease/phosphatase family protein [Mycobacteriales bacterium]